MRRMALLALFTAGCGASGAPPPWEARMPGLWLEERAGVAAFYWLKPGGTGERLRRSLPAGAWQDRVPAPLTWSVSGGALAIAVEGEPPRALGPIAGAERGVLTFQAPPATWYGCGSGRLPAEFEGLCRL